MKIYTKLSFSLFKLIGLIVIFILAQLSIWYGGLANLLPTLIFTKWNSLQLLGTMFLLGMLYIYRKIPNINSLLLIIMQMCQAFSTYLNNGYIDIVALSRFTCLILLLDLFSDNFELLINPFMIIFEIMTYYNLITVIQKGPDIYGSFYGALGYDNGFISYLLTAYFWALLYIYYKGKVIRPIILIMTINYTFIHTWSVTGLFGILVLDLLIILNIFIQWKLSLFKSFLLFLFTNFAIVFLRIQNVFSFIIEDLLHKDLTFTGRTNVWDTSIKKIPDKILLGYGNLGQEQEERILGDVYCHNGLLEILFRGGIIRLLLFGIIIYIISNKTKKYLDNKLYQSLIFCVSIIWIVSITESVLVNYIIFVMFSVLYIIPNPENVKRKKIITINET